VLARVTPRQVPHAEPRKNNAPVAFEEIKNIAEYEIERDLRPRCWLREPAVYASATISPSRSRTVTPHYQVQEMMRIERIVREPDIRHEIATYNELISGPGELGFAVDQYDTPEERNVWLRDLLGLENHVCADRQPSARARFDTRQIATDRISSVQHQVPPGRRGAEIYPRWRARIRGSSEVQRLHHSDQRAS
jgi:hypothetical protein